MSEASMYFRILHDTAGTGASYLLGDLEVREAVVIDPRVGDLPVLAAMLSEHRLQLRWTLRTHEHRVRQAREEALPQRLFGARELDPGYADDALTFGAERIEILSTPGHTAACRSFRWRDRLFCGGLLAQDGCRTQRSPERPDRLWDSVVDRVFALPDETLLFHGHFARGHAVSTVFEERRWHPWFAGTTRDEFLTRLAQPRAA